MAPATPKEAVAALKKGLVDLANDPEFRQDAMTTMKFVPNYDTSAEAEVLYQAKVKPNPAIVKFFEKYIEDGKSLSAGGAGK